MLFGLPGAALTSGYLCWTDQSLSGLGGLEMGEEPLAKEEDQLAGFRDPVFLEPSLRP